MIWSLPSLISKTLLAPRWSSHQWCKTTLMDQVIRWINLISSRPTQLADPKQWQATHRTWVCQDNSNSSHHTLPLVRVMASSNNLWTNLPLKTLSVSMRCFQEALQVNKNSSRKDLVLSILEWGSNSSSSSNSSQMPVRWWAMWVVIPWCKVAIWVATWAPTCQVQMTSKAWQSMRRNSPNRGTNYSKNSEIWADTAC